MGVKELAREVDVMVDVFPSTDAGVAALRAAIAAERAARDDEAAKALALLDLWKGDAKRYAQNSDSWRDKYEAERKRTTPAAPRPLGFVVLPAGWMPMSSGDMNVMAFKYEARGPYATWQDCAPGNVCLALVAPPRAAGIPAAPVDKQGK